MSLVLVINDLQREIHLREKKINNIQEKSNKIIYVGQLKKKKIKGNEYFYCLRKNDDIVKEVYLGNVKEVKKDEIEHIQNQYKEYISYINQQKELNIEIKKLQKALKLALNNI